MVEEHILFRNKKGIYEEHMSIAFFSLSIMDLCVVSIGAIISGIIWNASGAKTYDFTLFQFVTSITPLLISLVLALPKPSVAPVYVTLFRLFTMKKNKTDTRYSKKKSKKSKSKVLGFAPDFKRNRIFDGICNFSRF